MKMFQSKKIALLLTLMLLVPLIWNQNISIASAATPSFTQSKVEIVGPGEVRQLEIKDQVKGSKYKWSSSNTGVAIVTSKGIVTSVGAGSAIIKCVITYPTKKTKTLSCKVLVTIPATDIRISNAVEVNGAHKMLLGETFNFEEELVPVNTSDDVFWSIDGGDADCIKITDSLEGVVTATKAGKVILRATAAKTATQEAADTSIVNDAIIIEVVGPTATVKSAEITSSSEIKVVFDSPVNPNTVIGLNNKLSSNVEISQRKDVKGVLSEDPGKLTARLSADGKTLTITTEKSLRGEYGINFTSGIMTTTGVAIETYYKQLSFIDIFPPTAYDTTYDDTGMIATILFNEAIDFTNFKASNATLVASPGATASVSTISTLNNPLNYVIAADKKSVTINLSKIVSSDYGKLFSVTFSGIKDMAGNSPSTYTIPIYLKVDTSMRPQARVITVARTSYNTLTATYDRAIQYGGLISINNGPQISGAVDTTDSKKVNYTISEAEAQYSGVKPITIGYWNSFNVDPSDNYGRTPLTFYVDFTADRTSPVLIKYDFDTEKNILVLTYNEDIITNAASGIFRSRLVTANDEIKPDTNISYTVISHNDGKNILKLQLANLTLLGNYTFTTDIGFAVDNYRNQSVSSTITIGNVSSTSSTLPGPYAITQSTTNLSQVYVQFANKLDVASAQTVGNYAIAGVPIVSAILDKNTADNGATVILTVADGAIDVTVGRPITINGVRGYNNTFAAIENYTNTVELKDNKRPYFIDPVEFDKVSKTSLRINFNEQITGTMVVKVTQLAAANGSVPIEYGSSVSIVGSSVVVSLGSIPQNNVPLRVEIISQDIKDASGNATSAMPPYLIASVNY